jgi:hypothetical protein
MQQGGGVKAAADHVRVDVNLLLCEILLTPFYPTTHNSSFPKFQVKV